MSASTESTHLPAAGSAAEGLSRAEVRAERRERVDEGDVVTDQLDTAAIRRAAGLAELAESSPVPGAMKLLLRSAVTLQAEDLLRTVGAMALSGRDPREWCAMVEKDARDLAMLAVAAVSGGARLPAGLDGGSGDPADPGSPVEGLLASHEALINVLSQIVESRLDPTLVRPVIEVLARRTEEAQEMRGLGAGKGVPADVRFVHGALPKFQI